MKTEIIFRQLFDKETSTYTYLLGDVRTREAIIIDSVKEQVHRDLKLIEELGLKLKYVLDTHVHADHVTGADLLRNATGAKTVVGKGANVGCVDILAEDEQELYFGSHAIKVLSTPGHTDGCTSYLIDNMVFTGDVLFVRGTGRTDFQQGNPLKMYSSIKNKLYRLPDDTLVYPGHDYKGMSVTSIGEEKKYNPRIRVETSVEEFAKTMNDLDLPPPKHIHEAVPANMKCGQDE